MAWSPASLVRVNNCSFDSFAAAVDGTAERMSLLQHELEVNDIQRRRELDAEMRLQDELQKMQHQLLQNHCTNLEMQMGVEESVGQTKLTQMRQNHLGRTGIVTGRTPHTSTGVVEKADGATEAEYLENERLAREVEELRARLGKQRRQFDQIRRTRTRPTTTTTEVAGTPAVAPNSGGSTKVLNPLESNLQHAYWNAIRSIHRQDAYAMQSDSLQLHRLRQERQHQLVDGMNRLMKVRTWHACQC